MACNGSAAYPFSNYAIEIRQEHKEDLTQNLTHKDTEISILPALSFGNMLTVHGGSPFWRQRIVLKSLPEVIKAVQQHYKSQNPPSFGCLAVCSILCCIPSSLLSHDERKNMVPILIAGLVHLSKQVHDVANVERSPHTLDVLGLNLAAIVKILSQTSEVVSALNNKFMLYILTNKFVRLSQLKLVRFIGVIVPALLRLCVSATYNDEFLSKQMLALQCLENVAIATFPRNLKLKEQEHVVNALSTVDDHPSVIVRQAVVHVRNIWYTI